MHFSLRMGFGTGSDHSVLQSYSDARNQYEKRAPLVGIRSISSMAPNVEPWPSNMIHTLEERIKTATYHRKTSEDARENENLLISSHVAGLTVESETKAASDIFKQLKHEIS